MDPKSKPSESELNQLLQRTSTSDFRNAYITEKGFLLPERYLEMKKRIDDFEVFDTDVWICGFPKTGTTWISEIAWLIAKDFDWEGAKEVDYKRTRMLEFTMLFDPKKNLWGGEQYEVNSIGHAADQESPRTIKSHLPFPLLPQQIANGIRRPKIIYTARNPMDTCISYYHHCKNFEGFVGTLEEFCTLFLFDKVSYGPYPAHVLTFWEQRNEKNVLFLTYEDMQKDLGAVIDKVGQLLGRTVSEDQKKKLKEHVAFDSMKKNPAVNKDPIFKAIEGRSFTPFIRKGQAGGYKNVMSAEMIEKFRYWMGKKFEGSGLSLLD